MNNEQKIQLDPSDLTDLECPNCNDIYFETINNVKVISPLKTRSGEIEFLPIPLLKCTLCGHIIKNPKDVYENQRSKKLSIVTE
jgi:uncharacterized Zn finger protein